MSTIVVVRKGLRAVIASDSLFSQGSIKVPPNNKRNHHKIHRVKDAYIGFIGWSAFHNIFESVLKKFSGDLDFRSRQHVFETFLKLHPKLQKHFFLETAEDKDQPVESSQWNCLIAAPSGIFEVSSNRTVNEYTRFWADGSGIRFALGAMHSLYDRDEDVESIARSGVEAACEFDDGSGLPIQSFSVQLTGQPVTSVAAGRRRRKSL